FNAMGELVGITTFYLKDGQSLNFALPVEWIGEIAGKKIRERPFEWAGPPVPIEPKGPGARPQAAWLDRGKAFENARDWPGLLAHSRRWTQAEPGDPSAWFSLGVVYGKLSRHREAIEAYREGLRLNPDDAFAWNNLGDAYANMGRLHEAITAYWGSLRLKPDYVNAWCNLALALALSGNRSAALGAVKELRRYDPQKAENLFNLIMKP
ncbi:MAG: tetratricopeptide repeat protein, partial [Proteobacteria bacterium]|nr:tetratricopeptide repeat protein [Pseudomonadota bacterium]